jgi:signal transduction histidine kinase
MLLKNRNLLFKSSNFKNIIILCFIFIISALLIGLFSYSKINSYVVELSRAEVVEEFDDFILIYKEEGLKGVQEEISGEDPADETFFLRILKNGQSIAEFHPSAWEDFDITKVNKASSSDKYKWYGFEDDSSYYEYLSYNLSNELVMQMGHDIGERQDFFAFIQNIFIYSFIIILFITLLFGIFTADRSITPISKLMNTTSAIISRNDFKERVSLSGLDPLHTDLLGKFNYMLERIDKLIYGMRGTLDNIAHDIRTPLTRLRLSAEYGIHYGEEVQSLKESLHVCIEESDRIADFFNSFLEIAQASSGSLNLKMEDIKIKELVDTVVELYSHVAEEKNIDILVNIKEELVVKLDRVKMTLVLSNLVDNAIKYSDEGSEVIIGAVKDGEKITLNVVDTGIGIEPSEVDKIWEKLYRSNNGASVKGYGLGLSYAKAVVNAHNGDIIVSSQINSGSTFSIVLPC